MNNEPDLDNAADYIQWLVDQRKLVSDSGVLTELESLPVLPDETFLMKGELRCWKSVYLFLALSEISLSRKLIQAVPLILERACFGDLGETMRGLRHCLEGIVAPHWQVLTQACIKAINSSQPGARLWAVHQLGILRDDAGRQAVLSAFHDPEELIREAAKDALEMIDDK